MNIKVYQCVNKVVHRGCPSSAACVPKIKQVVGKCKQVYKYPSYCALPWVTFFGSDQVCALLVLRLGHPLSTHVNKPVSKLATLGLTAV